MVNSNFHCVALFHIPSIQLGKTSLISTLRGLVEEVVLLAFQGLFGHFNEKKSGHVPADDCRAALTSR